MKKTALFLFLSSLFVACDSDSTQVVKVDHKYSLEIPSSMSENNDLNEDASLGYQNLFQELYIIVIDENKNEYYDVIKENGLDEKYTLNLEGYSNLILKNMTSTMKNPVISDPDLTKINGMDARTVSISGTVDGLDIYWVMSFIEGRKQFYQIMSWTLASKKESHKAKLEKMVRSLKELDRSVTK